METFLSRLSEKTRKNMGITYKSWYAFCTNTEADPIRSAFCPPAKLIWKYMEHLDSKYKPWVLRNAKAKLLWIVDEKTRALLNSKQMSLFLRAKES